MTISFVYTNVIVLLSLVAACNAQTTLFNNMTATALFYDVCNFFVPLDSKMLWGSVWVFGMLTRNTYLQYLSTTVVWLDDAITDTVRLIDTTEPSSSWWCVEAQRTAAFYSSLMAHSYYYGPFPPHPWTLTVCVGGIVASTMVLLDNRVCSPFGALIAILFGSAVGTLRVSFYYEAISKHVF